MCRNVPKTVEETNSSLVQFPSSSVWVSWNKTVLWILFKFLTRSIFSGENLDPLKSLSGIGASLFSAGQVTKAAIQYITGLMVNNSRTLIYKIENRAEIILICKSLLNKSFLLSAIPDNVLYYLYWYKHNSSCSYTNRMYHV